MQPKLPLNAQAFFTKHKPDKYIYRSVTDAQGGLISGREVDFVDKMNNNPTHLTPPHLQPQIKVNKTNAQVTAMQASKPVVQSRAVSRPAIGCKYLTKTVNSGCGCAVVLCKNPECPLSTLYTQGGKKKINSNDCRRESCRWYAEN